MMGLQSAARAAGFVFVAMATRSLGPEEFSRYAVVTALVVLATYVTDFGTTPAITRSVSRSLSGSDEILSGTLWFSAVLGIAGYAAILSYAAVASTGGPLFGDVLIGGASVPLASLASSIIGALGGRGFLGTAALLSALQTAVTAVIGVMALLLGGGARAALVGVAVGPLVGLLLGVVCARHLAIWTGTMRIDGAATRLLVSRALPFALSASISGLAARVDVLLVSALSTGPQTSAYDVAVRLTEATSFLATAICGPALYLFARRLSVDDKEGASNAYQQALHALYLMAIPLTIVVALQPEAVATLAFGPEFAIAAPSLAVLAAGTTAAYLVLLQGAMVMAGERLLPGVARAGVALVVMLAMDLVLIPSTGALGAAIATVSANVLLAIALMVFIRRDGVAGRLPSIRLIGSGLAMALTVVVARPLGVIGASVIALAVYGASILVTGALGSEEIDRLRRVVRFRA